MKALTIWQPWATLLIEGCKPFEFRRRNYSPVPRPLIGQRIVLHAATRVPERSELRLLAEEPARLIASCGVIPGAPDSDAQLAKARDIVTAAWRYELELPLGAGIGSAILGAPVKAIDLYANRLDPEAIDPDVWAIPMLEPEIWERPLAAVGAQGFWEWDGDAR